jgi:DNA-binding winged helix-turn-helix (wHTH) protein
MSASFRFGEFELDVAAYTLRRTGRRVKLERIPMEMLLLLVRRPGSLVNRAEIQAALWGSQDRIAVVGGAASRITRTRAGTEMPHGRRGKG